MLLGIFLLTSINEDKYTLLLCHYDSKAILIRPLKLKLDNEMLHVYSKLYEYLHSKGFEIKLYVIDNEASKALKRQIIKP